MYDRLKLTGVNRAIIKKCSYMKIDKNTNYAMAIEMNITGFFFFLKIYSGGGGANKISKYRRGARCLWKGVGELIL